MKVDVKMIYNVFLSQFRDLRMITVDQRTFLNSIDQRKLVNRLRRTIKPAEQSPDVFHGPFVAMV